MTEATQMQVYAHVAGDLVYLVGGPHTRDHPRPEHSVALEDEASRNQWHPTGGHPVCQGRCGLLQPRGGCGPVTLV